jgi:hypothetical protein
VKRDGSLASINRLLRVCADAPIRANRKYDAVERPPVFGEPAHRPRLVRRKGATKEHLDRSRCQPSDLQHTLRAPKLKELIAANETVSRHLKRRLEQELFRNELMGNAPRREVFRLALRQMA